MTTTPYAPQVVALCSMAAFTRTLKQKLLVPSPPGKQCILLFYTVDQVITLFRRLSLGLLHISKTTAK